VFTLLKRLKKWLKVAAGDLFREARIGHKQRRQQAWEERRSWENIERVPPWIQKAIEGIYKEHGGSSLGQSHFIVKGRSYFYRLTFSGQGGPSVSVERSPRRKG
jgi:hypothetical protein